MIKQRLLIHFIHVLVYIFLTAPSLHAQESWINTVRIGGYSLSIDRTDSIVTAATSSNVYGIEVDNDITGRYESFLDPTEKLEAIRKLASTAHSKGNYAFVYIAGLECITDHVNQKDHSFYKDHPDWVQRNINGKPAIFSSDDAFWIAEGDEDVWISPYAREWRDIYMERVRQIAATGIDGIYVDIPYWMTHFEGWTDTWASFDDYTVKAFKDETGIDAKTQLDLGNYNDPNFIEWIDFRMKTLTDFMKEIDENVKSVNPEAKTIAEVYPGLGNDAVIVGADVYEMYSVVDAIAHEYSMGENYAADRAPLDWFKYMIGMHTFRAFADEKASWMLSYSWYDNDDVNPAEAMKSMFASQVFSGTNVWDTRGYVMSSSNDIKTRMEAYNWIKNYQDYFYSERKPIDPVGVYFSPSTRNVKPDEYIDSYSGITQLLINNHIEFQIVTPRTLAEFSGKALILDNVKKVSEEELAELERLSNSGVKILTAGDTQKFDFSDAIYSNESAGKEYSDLLTNGFNDYFGGTSGAEEIKKYCSEFREKLDSLIDDKDDIIINAPLEVFTSTSSVNDKPSIYITNVAGICESCGKDKADASDVKVEINPSSGYTKAYSLPFMGSIQELRLEQVDDKLICKLPPIDRGTLIWFER